MLSPADRAFDAGRLVCAELDGTMTAAGFRPGQAGCGPGWASVTFCTPLRDLRDRFPALAPDLVDGRPGTCADLTVSVEAGGAAEPRLVRVDLDGSGLRDLLHDVGRDDRAPDAADLGRLPLGAALTRLDGLLADVLRRAATTTADTTHRPGERP